MISIENVLCFSTVMLLVLLMLWTLSFMSYCESVYDDGYRVGVRNSLRYKNIAEKYDW